MLLDGRFDAVGVQYMQLSHEKGAAALGQELSAFGWALYDLDGEDEYLFVLIPQGEREAFEAFCKQQGQYCRLMKQPRCGWGDHAREQAPGAVMPCEEYILEDEYDYFFNSMAGDFAAGEWKPRGGENWQNGCVADLRQRPPQVTRARSLPGLCSLTYSPKLGVYGAARSGGSGIGRALVGKNPANLNWFEPSPVSYDGPPRFLRWIGNFLWVGDPCNATRIELTDPEGGPELAAAQGRLERQLPLRHRGGWTGPGVLFQRVVKGDDLPLGGRSGDQAFLSLGRIRPSFRSGARPRHWLHLHDPRRQRQRAGGGMPAGA